MGDTEIDFDRPTVSMDCLGAFLAWTAFSFRPCGSCPWQREKKSIDHLLILLTDFLVIVLIDVVIGLIKLIIIKSGLVSLSYHIMKVNHVLLPELNQRDLLICSEPF